MVDLVQKDRIYELRVGDTQSGNGLLITNNLQISFDVSKASSNKDRTNSASIEIYNLSDDSLKLIDVDYPFASLSVGYRQIGLKQIISGQVTDVTTRKSGTDRITLITIGSAYKKLNHELISKTLPPGKVRDAFEELAKQIGVSRTVFNSVNLESPIINGYPLSGTKREMLDELSEKYGVDWQIDDDTLYVHDSDRGNSEKFELAYVVSKYTGLIENAYRVSGDVRRSEKDKVKKPGVQFKMLLNPDIVAGSILKLEDTLIQGWIKVDSLRHSGSWRGNDWYTEVQCSMIEKVVNNA